MKFPESGSFTHFNLKDDTEECGMFRLSVKGILEHSDLCQCLNIHIRIK